MNMILHNRLVPRRVDLFSEFSKEFDKISNEMFGAPFFKGINKHKGYPLLDAIKSDNELVIQYSVPGVSKDNLSVEVVEDDEGLLLVIAGRLSDQYVFNEDQYCIRELSKQDFRRILRLPEDIDNQDPSVVLSDGILALSFKLKKSKEKTPKVRQLTINDC